MTIFESKVYKKTDENIVGAEVIAKDSDGREIESLQIVDETQLEELVARLDVLGDTYVQFEEDSSLEGMTIEEILENENSDAVINASQLDGYYSNQFSKTNHTHSYNSLTGVLNYELTASDYDIGKSDTITLKVKVTNATNSPVANSPVVLLLDGSSFANGNTNASGEFTTTYTPSNYGLKHFSVNNTSIDINVRTQSVSMKTVVTGKAWIYYNNELRIAQLVINGDFSIGSSGDITTVSTQIPRNTIPLSVYTDGMRISFSDSGVIHYINSGSIGSKRVVASATYFYY